MAQPVQIVFLGGINEIGKNMVAFETERDIIIVDCGMGFPELVEHPGIDLLLPDIGYLKDKRDKIRGMFVTHGHEDHIGAIPYLWEEIPCPIYATPFTAALIMSRMREKKLADRVEMNVFDAATHPTLTAGEFTLEPFRVTHSVPDCVGFAITTPAGLVVMTGDYRFDSDPIDGRESDIEAIKAIGDRGVALMIGECTNAERLGRTPGEKTIEPELTDLITNAPGRVILATFSSQLARVQQTINAAAKAGKRVSVLGRSLETNVRIAAELGYLKENIDALIPSKIAFDQPQEELVWIVTGCQGEENAVLSRLANRDHQKLTLVEGDRVIISASAIPGNEYDVYRMIDALFIEGADVFYPPLAEVHVSGHAYRDELREMVQYVRPQHLIPTHGEPRMRYLYADLAVEEGVRRENICIPMLGDIVTLSERGVSVTGEFEAGSVFVEGDIVGDGNKNVLHDRVLMGQDGIVTIALGIDWDAAEIVSGPKVHMRGFSSIGENPDLERLVQDAVIEDLGRQLESGDTNGAYRVIREAANRVIFKRSRQRPVVMPIILNMPRS